MPKVTTNGIKIFHEVYGAGSPLVYICGAVSDLRLGLEAKIPLEPRTETPYWEEGFGQ